MQVFELLDESGKLVYAKTNMGLDKVLLTLHIVGYKAVAYNKIKVNSVEDKDCNLILIK